MKLNNIFVDLVIVFEHIIDCNYLLKHVCIYHKDT